MSEAWRPRRRDVRGARAVHAGGQELPRHRGRAERRLDVRARCDSGRGGAVALRVDDDHRHRHRGRRPARLVPALDLAAVNAEGRALRRARDREVALPAVGAGADRFRRVAVDRLRSWPTQGKTTPFAPPVAPGVSSSNARLTEPWYDEPAVTVARTLVGPCVRSGAPAGAVRLTVTVAGETVMANPAAGGGGVFPRPSPEARPRLSPSSEMIRLSQSQIDTSPPPLRCAPEATVSACLGDIQGEGSTRCARHDSNMRPLPPQGSALSPELRARGREV